MKYLILLFISQLAVARPSQQSLCYKAVSGRNSTAAMSFNWDKRIREVINSATAICAGQDENIVCWRDLLKALENCDGIGGKSLQAYVDHVRADVEAKLPKAKTAEKVQPGASGQ